MINVDDFTASDDSLTVEDGSGVPGADSLVSVAEADVHHAQRGRVAWAEQSEERKAQLLREAFDWLTFRYGTRWPAGEPFGTVAGVVMKGAKNACAQLALYAVDGPLVTELAAQVTKQKVGPIETEYAAAPAERTFPDVVRMMAPYLVPINRYSIPLRRV